MAHFDDFLSTLSFINVSLGIPERISRPLRLEKGVEF
jgi:hypothetical protein